MSASPPVPAHPLRRLWPIAVAAVVAFAYAFGHLGWYLGTPLGRVPVLDELENLNLAEVIFRGTLPAEPFYRAPGYALVLATLRALGVTAAGLFPAALALGAVLHAVNAGLIARITWRWFGPAAALAAGLLAALHPVFVHYATQALDAAAALTLFLLGLNFLVAAQTIDRRRELAWLGASVCWAAATLMRPNYFLVWLTLPLLAAVPLISGARGRRTLAAVGGAVLFAALATWQWRVGGEFGFLPAQGAYNFWAANQPGAHGRYYTQQLDLPPTLARQNPARAESMLLYTRATGRPADDLAAVNAYWSRRTREEIAAHPVAWLGRLGRKAYALVNDWEQYNNKTFAFHQARSPWLRWNPLSWGVLLVLAVAGLTRLRATAPNGARVFAIVALAVAGSAILFFVSARFRLPLAALLCVPAGAALAHPLELFRALTPRGRAAFAAVLVATAFVTFSNFAGVRDTRPFLQDHLLIARAAQEVGDDSAVWDEAAAALVLAPTRREANEFLVTSGFNRQLTASLTAAELTTWRASASRLLASEPPAAPAARIVAAVATRDVPLLRALSREPAPAGLDALGALVLTDAAASPDDLARLRAAPLSAGSTFYLMARQAIDADAFEAWARTRQEPPGWSRALATARARIFPPATSSK